MAIVLEAAYSKKLGLPNFSSHSYVVSIRTELNDIDQVQEESARLYRMLQEAVDKEIKEVGFMPDATQYGMNGNGNGNGNGHSNGASQQRGEQRRNDAGISEKQLDLINRIVRENNANKGEIEKLALDMFDVSVRGLNRLQASNFIDELFVRYPRRNSTSNGAGKFRREAART